MLTQINILFAEDHKLFRQLLISALNQYNIVTVAEAEDGIQLLDILKTKKIDLILLDIEMPNMDGSITFEIIRKLYPEVKIIFLTTHNEAFLIEHFYLKGASAYLTKNTDTRIVAETIRLVHENKYIPLYEKRIKKNTEGEDLKFSKRETEIIPLICEGKSNKEIADTLHIGNKAVEAHKKNLFRKTKTMSVVECVVFLIKKGLNNLR
jgi:DNA-binding NarL/FixJ family response regulator